MGVSGFVKIGLMKGIEGLDESEEFLGHVSIEIPMGNILSDT
jgi:hypothetical protein